jgi:EAL domain-containing protein (putative c-di-GMP-specific phosphodiesterase class I)
MQTDRMSQTTFVPLFQPIYSVEDLSVVAYESLETNDESFDLTLQTFSEAKGTDSLFVNITPDRLLLEVEQAQGLDFPIVQKIKKYKIEPSSVYLEISERTCVRGLESLSTAVEMFKELGFKIALDDVGSESSNLERLCALKPDIIKVDLNLLKRSIHSQEFQSILEYLKDISLGLGSELLFEGIESEEELHRAVDSGARYLQGNLLGKPASHFMLASQAKNFLKPFLESFHAEKRKVISKEINFETKMRELFDNLEIPIKHLEKRILVDAHSVFKLSPAIRRVYVTDWDGTQVSPYYEKFGPTGFKENTQNLQKNWSYLPFFYKHVKQAFRSPNAWQISEPYYDRALNEKLVVFSKILEGQLSIFIDVSYQKL